MSTEANTEIGDKKRRLYDLVDMHGRGKLLPWMHYAKSSGDHSFIDAYIDTEVRLKKLSIMQVREFLYNDGKGKEVTIAELVKMRYEDAMMGASVRKKGTGKSGPSILEGFNQEDVSGNLKKAFEFVDGDGSEPKCREIVWKLNERGSMGENIIGVCLVHGTTVHNLLVMKLIITFPKLVNDISVSEEYYGLSPLHQAIINQDVPMVSFLLRREADVNQRCYGAFFCAEDQRSSRTDSVKHEYVKLSLKTNYVGHLYFGEYPLSFAVCMNDPDSFRLLAAKGANIHAQDTNGNTIVHMCVIHEKMDMLRLAVEYGASLRILNKQGHTPLTLAAKLAKKSFFHEILNMERVTVWTYGDASQMAYPLAKIDTINEKTGELNEESALSQIVYGDTDAHLELIEGLLEDLLQSKWETFARRKWLISLAAFTVYYTIFFMAFMSRPFSWTTSVRF